MRSCTRPSSSRDALSDLGPCPDPTLSPRRYSPLSSASLLYGRSGFRTSTSPMTPPTIHATPPAFRVIERHGRFSQTGVRGALRGVVVGRLRHGGASNRHGASDPASRNL